MGNKEDDFNFDFIDFDKEPVYFYRVSEYVTTFEKEKSYSNIKDFKTGTLKECKVEAEKYYNERMQGFRSGKAKFFLPFESPTNFKKGENAAFSLTLAIVEYYHDNDYTEYVLLGEDEQTCADSREVEAFALKSDQ
jgi:hypothetical protein